MGKDNNQWPVGVRLGFSGDRADDLSDEVNGLIDLINAGYGKRGDYQRITQLASLIALDSLENAELLLASIRVPPDKN